MKKINLLLIAVLAFLIGSCSSSTKTSDKQAQEEYFASIQSSVYLCIDTYDEFSTFTSELTNYDDQKTKSNELYDAMKVFDEAKKKLSDIKVPEGSKEEKEIGEKFKDAAAKLIDVFIDGRNKEFAEINDILNNNTIVSDDDEHLIEIYDKAIKFYERKDKVFDVYWDARDVYAEKYNIEY